jgi:hypothetical protein
MQKCLNDIVIDLYEICKKSCVIYTVLITYILVSITLCIFGFLCIMTIDCPGINKYLLLETGFGAVIIIVIYILIPCGLRFILNCLWYKQYKRDMSAGQIITV